MFEQVEGKDGHRWWLWVFIAGNTVVFRMDPTRSPPSWNATSASTAPTGRWPFGGRPVGAVDAEVAFQDGGGAGGVGSGTRPAMNTHSHHRWPSLPSTCSNTRQLVSSACTCTAPALRAPIASSSGTSRSATAFGARAYGALGHVQAVGGQRSARSGADRQAQHVLLSTAAGPGTPR